MENSKYRVIVSGFLISFNGFTYIDKYYTKKLYYFNPFTLAWAPHYVMIRPAGNFILQSTDVSGP